MMRRGGEGLFAGEGGGVILLLHTTFSTGWDMWITLSFVLSLSCLVSCAWLLYRIEQLSSRLEIPSAPERWQTSLAQLTSEMSDLKLSYDSLLASHERLRSRVGMREVRSSRREGPASLPTDRGELKAHLRKLAGIAPGQPVKVSSAIHTAPSADSSD